LYNFKIHDIKNIKALAIRIFVNNNFYYYNCSTLIELNLH